ncbi:1-acyl-sn-glycerol-3-phosphate acyltransferase [Niabella yanshanensis]|uniref:1-acyl-sn-glycerol-3-phosphate acyltransferase n=1 Tax=Niabella yanshanensis TaxID=577386 RepID=A0ABZ0WDL1_9BACT|nr:trifunctional MMPL family transporter/lysophospholipid acyltransferase/class I SAM-dependent methyltransferase [Niabella yanshanensis]WQD40778.1 1-acyl-sn-glycerol-3-phosphate acyltransferase [Niabella yanshanensis]
MQNIFLSIYNFFCRNKAALYIVFVSTLALFAFFALRVKFEEDVYAIIPKDAKTEKLTEVFGNSKFADKLVVMVSLKDSSTAKPDQLVKYADVFAEALRQRAEPFIKNIRYKIDEAFTYSLFESIQQHLPVFLTEADYKKIDTLLQPAELSKSMSRSSSILGIPASNPIKNIVLNDPSGISFLALKKLQQLQYEDNFTLHNNHFVTKDKKTLLLFLAPSFAAGNTGKNQQFFRIIDHTVDSLNKAGFADIQTQYFGGAVVSQSNAAQLRKDTLLTQGVTVLFLIVFLGIYFRKKRAPLLILMPVIYGAAFSLAAIYFIKGSISVIALGTGSIVLGIAVNYSLHVFNHSRHHPDIKEVIRDLSFPLTIGSITTILGFLSLQYAASDMLKDLGLFAGFSLIGAAVCSLVFLPHFIRSDKTRIVKTSWLDQISSIRLESNKWLVAGIIVITIVLYPFAKKVGFEPDMMQLNYMSPKLKQAEATMNSISGAALKSVYIVSEGNNLDDALEKNESLQSQVAGLKAKGLINTSSGVSDLFMSDSLQRLRINRWNAYWTPEKKQQVLSLATLLAPASGFTVDGLENFRALLNRPYEPVTTQKLQPLRSSFLDDYLTEQNNKASVVTLIKVPEQHKPRVLAELERRPDAIVLDRQYLTSRLTQMVNDDFNRIAWIISIIVATMLLLTYGRIELMLMSFIPMAISWIWILGIMSVCGIQFNIVNIIISALIFGLGDDYSLFVMDGLLNEYKTGKKNLASYKSSILLSAITTVAGLGVLIFAKHPALRSIAFISVTGILCVVIMSQILIPFFFSMVIKKRIDKGFHPWTLWSWSRSVFSFFYFGFVSVLLTILGLFLIKLKVVGYKKGKFIYHYLLSKFCMSVLYIMGNFKKRQINLQGENFDKPAVVIANHQSFLDILQMAMLNPRLILLTNRWVWNSPVFGWAIKMADFYPVANGVENSVDLLNTQVQQGYSISVFPEGTRTSQPPMKRFHKGAFYLAEQLKLDMVPVLFHGLGYTMTKGDFLLKNGPVTAKYLPRIKADDASWGTTYQERTKNISRYFKEQHEALTKELEQPAYFKEHLFFNYIYKGPVLEWYLKIKLKLENYYQPFHELLPNEGRFLDLGCGYGFMCYTLHWASQGRRLFTGVDYDEDKIATAQHCFSRTEALQFVRGDIATHPLEKYNGIIISDVLHYLQPIAQEQVIAQAIDSLLPRGILIIRDGDADLKEKHKGTKFTELLSTKIFSFNKTTNQLHFLSGKMIEALAIKKEVTLQRIDHTKYTSNVIWVIRK